LALAALSTAGITAFLVQGWMERQRAQVTVRAPVQAEGTNVLVAKNNLGAGSFVQEGDIRWQPWPEGNLSPSYVVKGKRKETDFVGSVVRKGIVAGQPITDAGVVKVGERGFLAAVLKPGLRAITVPVNATSAIAGLVFPGDRVDLILTHKYQSAGGENGRKLRQASETLLTNVRILAIDQSTDDQKGSNGKKTTQRVPKTTTLEVTPKQVEIIHVALTLGQLSLSLRSLAKKETEQARSDPVEEVIGERGRTLTRDNEVSRLLYGDGKQVTVLRGSGAKKKGGGK
jgi:pilus assembly protein CpaB